MLTRAGDKILDTISVVCYCYMVSGPIDSVSYIEGCIESGMSLLRSIGEFRCRRGVVGYDGSNLLRDSFNKLF